MIPEPPRGTLFSSQTFRSWVDTVTRVLNSMVQNQEDNGIGLPFMGVFPVLLEEDGGANGTGTTAPTYTYTLKSLDGGITFATALSPNHRPINKGSVISGDGRIGMACFDHIGDIKLLDAAETWQLGPVC